MVAQLYWYRLECSLGRSSLVGTTVQAADRLPRHLVADEKHTTLADPKARKVYLAATAGGGCCLGMALAETADADELTRAYGVFRDEARRRAPVPPGDGQHRWLARHPGGLAGAVPGGDADPTPARHGGGRRAGRCGGWGG